MRPRTVTDEYGTVTRTPVVHNTPCGKHGYSSRKLAASVAATVRRERGETVTHYHCSDCHGWHIGHPPGLRGRPVPNRKAS